MKKKLKNVWLMGLILTAAVLLAGGCGKKATPENLLTDMVKNSKEVKSVSSNMKLAAEMGDDTDTLALNLDADIEATRKPQASHIEGEVGFKFSGTDLGTDIEVYQVKEDDEIVSYIYVQGQWMRQTTDAEGNVLDEGMYEGFKEAYKSFELEKDLVEINDRKCYELKGKVDGDILSGIIDQDMMDSFASGVGLDADGMKEAKIPCVIDIYEDSILPARIHIDMKDVFTKAMGDKYEGFEVKEYYAELTYDEYDKVDNIKVPKEAKEATKAGSTEGGDSESFFGWESDDGD